MRFERSPLLNHTAKTACVLLVYQVLSSDPYSQTWSCTARVPGPIYSTIQPKLLVYCSCTRSYLLNHTAKTARVLLVYQVLSAQPYSQNCSCTANVPGPRYSTIQPKLLVYCSCTRSYLLNHTAKTARVLFVYRVLSTQPHRQNWSCTARVQVLSTQPYSQNCSCTSRVPGPRYSTTQPNLLAYQLLKP